MHCVCETTNEMWDRSARVYAETHLEAIETRASGWEVLYRCPKTGWNWLEDYPQSEEQGGGPMRLQRRASQSTGRRPQG